MPDKTKINLEVNGKPYELMIGKDIISSDTLAETLRNNLGLLGTKISCDRGACGACTVILNGKAVLSCTMLTVECDGMSITTIEGLEDPKTGELHPLQQSFIDHTAFQCGFCTPGIILTVKALLNQNPKPREDEIKQALSGNFCRCISHYEVLEAVTAVIEGGKYGK
jgi:aerobic-type carbon monoxide dehydrogenase small subunit (CoxS/CutS family)